MYLNWDKKTVTDFSDENVNSLYGAGYLFTRVGKGTMDQTRSIRIDLSKFELSSENRRILRKTENIDLKIVDLPYSKYDWMIGKLAKDFYTTKFGDGTFSANKIKELLTTKHNLNKLFSYVIPSEVEGSLFTKDGPTSSEKLLHQRDSSASSLQDSGRNDNVIGYCICCETNELIHYCYPFYDLDNSPKDTGLGMMTRAVLWAKENNKKYVYLGSFQRPTDTYKLQFAGIEWFDGERWSGDLERLKQEVK